MKKISTLATILLLNGCSTTATIDETEQVPEETITQAQTPVEEVVEVISLTVATQPSDARVRIMNIKPKYESGIELKEGKYDIEVSKSGYNTYREWVVVDKKTILTVELDKTAEI
ncbi:PEGA domain-containing protein [Pseudoalteromonas arctica]|uniref:PEGA domain-containing protein n=1 Tax=Pseudoalteromonas arctica TaxID=394751 RepID=A0A7Y0DV38_9GAMM|nr:PEGA domain-containing protein [Pseudoalteromonas arctica]NMM42115.1 PEGA domain-containing protein [Pseudoalteromonas arctica]